MNKGFLPLFLKRLPSLFGSFLASLSARRDLTPVPKTCHIIRLARPSKDYLEKRKISAVQVDPLEFKPSSLDEKSIPPHLSVWVDDFTTPRQAYSFLEENSLRKLVLWLKVEEVCSLAAFPGKERTYLGFLKVIWVHLFKDPETRKIRDQRPGAKGHSGITGLEEVIPEGLTKQEAKLLRKSFRAQLAELASKDSKLLDK